MCITFKNMKFKNIIIQYSVILTTVYITVTSQKPPRIGRAESYKKTSTTNKLLLKII